MRIKLEAISFCLNIDRASRGNIAVVFTNALIQITLIFVTLFKKKGKSCFKLISRKRRSRRKKKKNMSTNPFNVDAPPVLKRR